MNYENLKDAIVAVIKQNGNEEITGNILQQVLVAMVNSLGSGYQFRGIATPETNPGTPDQRIFYLASATGTYSDFGFIVSDEICALVYDTAWHKQTIIALDQEPTEDSGNLLSSGAIYTALQNLADTYMQLVESAEENHLAIFDGGGQVKDAGKGLDELALPAGHYPDLFAGFAGNLVDIRSAGTRQGPFAFRQSGGDGVNYMRKILGRTEVFNQLAQNGNFADTSNWSAEDGISFSVSSNEAHLSMSGGAYASGYLEQIIQLYAGHNYLICFAVKCGNAGSRARILTYGGEGAETLIAWTNYSAWTNVRQVVAATKNNSSFRIYADNSLDQSGDVSVDVKNFFLVDLTLEGLGLTTADQFRALHPLGNYTYKAGVLINNAATGLETVGFNQWDEETRNGYYNDNGEFVANAGWLCNKNLIPVFENTTYYIQAPVSCRVLAYDANGAFISAIGYFNQTTFTTPAGTRFLNFHILNSYGNVYKHDICINLSDASRNDTYEPYWKRDIVLGLDNLACHDENNNAVVVNGLDGVGTAQDEGYGSNGYLTHINKKMEEVDLGDLAWTKDSDGIFISSVIQSAKATTSGYQSGNIICTAYKAAAPQSMVNSPQAYNKSIGLYVTRELYADNQEYADAAAFKAAMAGVKLRFELATPKVLTLDNPIPALIEVDNLGTEKRLPEDTADNPQGPFESDSNYSISTANLVRKLSEQ